jgi:hypothetical protein
MELNNIQELNRDMKTILNMMYGISDERDDDLRNLIKQMSSNLEEFLTELESNKELNLREKFYIIALMTSFIDQRRHLAQEGLLT